MEREEQIGNETTGWYCLRTQPKREHIASVGVRTRVGVETFCPRITYVRATRKGKAKVTEALFPCYIFARCAVDQHYRHLLAINGVSSVVRYGNHFAAVPESFIGQLRASLPEETLEEAEPVLTEGAEVEILVGPFKNFSAVVKGLVPAKERVNLLLDFLGRQIEAELPQDSVLLKGANPRRGAFA